MVLSEENGEIDATVLHHFPHFKLKIITFTPDRGKLELKVMQ
jgi:hypothetical protein